MRAPAHGEQQPSRSHGSATAADGGGATRCVCAHAFLGWQGVDVRGGARQTNTKCLLQPRRGPRRCITSCRQGHGGLKRKAGKQSQVLGVCARRRAAAVVRCTEVKATRGGQTYGCGPVARGKTRHETGAALRQWLPCLAWCTRGRVGSVIVRRVMVCGCRFPSGAILRNEQRWGLLLVACCRAQATALA